MSWIDWVVFLGFLAYVVGDGLRRARGTRDIEGYFAANRSIPWWAAGLSVMATQASAITVIGTTGQGHEGGMEFVQFYFGLPFAMIVLSVFFIPIYRRSPILSAYEFLEGRFGPATRTLASLIFLVSRCLAFGVVIYAPAVVLSAMTGVDQTATVVFIGALTTLYTMFGGIRAVIWTDVKQMTVILGGLFVCLVILLIKILPQIGLTDGLRVLSAADKLSALELRPESTSFVPRAAGASDGVPSFWEEKYNLWSGLLGGLFLHMAYFGCDQSQVQRILTNPTANDSRRALLLSAVAKVPMQALVLFIGVLLYLFHVLGDTTLFYAPENRALAQDSARVAAVEDLERRLERAAGERKDLALRIAGTDDAASADGDLIARFRASTDEVRRVRAEAVRQVGGRGETNYIFPHFILYHVPPILLGLIIAAIFAAAMSSADSALNSLTAASIVDLYRRWFRPRASERESLLAARGMTLFWGAFATVFALTLTGKGSIIEVINRIGSYFYGSLLGVFALALLCPWAGARAGFLGLISGMASVLVVHNTLQVEFLWYNVIGCVGVLVVGAVVGMTDRPRHDRPRRDRRHPSPDASTNP